MPPTRILELRATYRSGGGPDKTILLSAAAHDPDRLDVRCAYLRGARDLEFSIGQKARSLHISYEEVVERRRFDMRALASLVRIVRRFRPHVIHTHDYKSDIIGFFLRQFFPGAALLATAHGWTLDNPRMNAYNWADLKVLRRFDRLIAVSEATRDRMTNAGIPSSRITVLYNGIDVSAWSPSRNAEAVAELESSWDIPSGAPVLGFIGRLSPEKDVPLAMRVARRVISEVPDTHVVVIGDGAAQDDLPALMARLNLSQRVRILGYQPVTPAIYHALDVYFMSSKTEGLPNTLLEAMACGCASVVPSIGGIPELVASSGGAIVCPPGDERALTRGILDLLEDPQRAKQVGRAARARILEAFSFDERLRRIEALYESLAR